MRYFTFIAVAVLSVGADSAALSSREQGWSVYITTDPEWGYREKSGYFEDFPIRGFDVCIPLKGGNYYKNISSFGPGKSVKCIVYDGDNCDGNSEPIFYSGYADMGWNGWDNRVASYQCGFCIVGVDEGCRDTIL